MRDHNRSALDTSWEAAMLNIKLGALHIFFMLDNILLPLTLQSLSDTLFFPLLLHFLQKNMHVTDITLIPRRSAVLA